MARCFLSKEFLPRDILIRVIGQCDNSTIKILTFVSAEINRFVKDNFPGANVTFEPNIILYCRFPRTFSVLKWLLDNGCPSHPDASVVARKKGLHGCVTVAHRY